MSSTGQSVNATGYLAGMYVFRAAISPDHCLTDPGWPGYAGLCPSSGDGVPTPVQVARRPGHRLWNAGLIGESPGHLSRRPGFSWRPGSPLGTALECASSWESVAWSRYMRISGSKENQSVQETLALLLW